MGVTIEFFVAGLPRPGGSKRAFYVAKLGRAVITEDCKTSKDWRAAVAQAAHEAMAGRPLLTGPLRLTIRFRFPRPKGHYRTGKKAAELRDSAPRYHVTKPDTTKLVRSTEDALKGIIWRDDSQVARQTASKAYAWDGGGADGELGLPAGALVRIEEL